MLDKFPVQSEDCEILLKFEAHPSLQELSEVMAKDPSVVSRQLKRISEQYGLLEKSRGRWQLTEKAKALNEWTREAVFAQKLALKRQTNIKIATTREFASRILLPNMRDLVDDNKITVSIISDDSGIEEALLKGDADFGFDCGRPVDPLIAFKTAIDESFVVVASPDFIQQNKIQDYGDLEKTDYLKFRRTESFTSEVDVEARRYYGTFTEIANLREACILGYGWTVLPYYTVSREVHSGLLKIVDGNKIPPARYGVWWLRERKSVEPWIQTALKWLKQQDLKIPAN